MMLELKNFSAGYGDKIILKALNWQIPEGKTALIGANGAGKSTLFLTLLGLLPALGGEATLDGLSLKRENFADIRKNIGFLFQNPDDQLFCATVIEDICFGLPTLNALQKKALTQEILNELGAAHLWQNEIHKLSFGEKRKVALAGVLCRKPQSLFLDEPSSGLDPKGKRDLIKLLQNLSLPCLIATHDYELAASCCTHVAVLFDGNIALSGGIELFTDGTDLQQFGL